MLENRKSYGWNSNAVVEDTRKNLNKWLVCYKSKYGGAGYPSRKDIGNEEVSRE